MNALVGQDEIANALASRYGWSPEQVTRLQQGKVYADSFTPSAFGINFVKRGVADALRRDQIRRAMAARSANRTMRDNYLSMTDEPEYWQALMQILP